MLLHKIIEWLRFFLTCEISRTPSCRPFGKYPVRGNLFQLGGKNCQLYRFVPRVGWDVFVWGAERTAFFGLSHCESSITRCVVAEILCPYVKSTTGAPLKIRPRLLAFFDVILITPSTFAEFTVCLFGMHVDKRILSSRNVT